MNNNFKFKTLRRQEKKFLEERKSIQKKLFCCMFKVPMMKNRDLNVQSNIFRKAQITVSRQIYLSEYHKIKIFVRLGQPSLQL